LRPEKEGSKEISHDGGTNIVTTTENGSQRDGCRKVQGLSPFHQARVFARYRKASNPTEKTQGVKGGASKILEGVARIGGIQYHKQRVKRGNRCSNTFFNC
jgi:hypothetical protein